MPAVVDAGAQLAFPRVEMRPGPAAGVRESGAPRQAAGVKAEAPPVPSRSLSSPVSSSARLGVCCLPCPPFCGLSGALPVRPCMPALGPLLVSAALGFSVCLSFIVYLFYFLSSRQAASADTTATVEDMLPSVTTVTANSDTITETFATGSEQPHQ